MVKRRPRDVSPIGRLFMESGRLKSEPRRGWLKKLEIEHPESVADHSYRMALMSMVLSDQAGLDTGRAVMIALIHDLPEALVGDSMPEERSGPSKVALETDAMKRLLAGLPAKLQRRYLGYWRDYTTGRSKEARLVKQLDKLELAIQAWEYVNNGSADVEEARVFMKRARSYVLDEELVQLLDQFDF